MVGFFKRRLPYLIATVLLLVVEIFIGVFVHDNFVRPYIGDVLVTVLLCTFGQMIFLKCRFIPIVVFLFSAVVELCQLIELDRILGIEGSVLGIVVGSTFDVADIVCYAVGCIVFFTIQYFIKNKKPSVN